jgi:hypothetical protein
MKHLKTYENWFTNIFKSSNDPWQDWESDYGGVQLKNGYSALMDAALEGNWKRFKNLLPDYKEFINVIHNDNGEKKNMMISVIDGLGDTWDKKKMIVALIENGVDVFFENENGETFYDIIKNRIETTKLKEWFDETYPDIVIKLETTKYNI